MVQTGLERWLREGPGCANLTGPLRYGLVAHPSSIGRDGRHFLETAAASPAGLPARAVFPSPMTPNAVIIGGSDQSHTGGTR